MLRAHFAIVLFTLVLIGCAAAPPAGSVADPIGTPPEDFTIDLTILAAPQPSENLPAEVHLRPSRFVIFPDGSFHFGVDDDSRGAHWLPGLTRRLDRDQMSRIWTLARNLGLADPQRASQPINFKSFEAQPGSVRYLATFTAHEHRWAFIHSSPLDEPEPAMVEFVRALAQLAWADEMPIEQRETRIGRRYDFGPDPYARYRR